MRYILLFILLFVFNCIFAQNNFVYVFQDKNVASWVIPTHIDSLHSDISSRDGKFIMYVRNNGTNPYKVKEWNDWIRENGVRDSFEIGGLKSYDEDLSQLSCYLVEIFDESVKDGLNIVGRNDRTWTFSFIVPQSVWDKNNDLFAKFIYVNQLCERGISLKLFVYNEEKINEVEFKLENSNVFKFEN